MNIQVMKLDSQGWVLLIIFLKKAKTLIIMINIANNSLVNTQNNIPKVYIVERKLGHIGRLGNLIWSF